MGTRKALVVDLNAAPGAIAAIDDADGFDAEDCSLYAVADGDDDMMFMIEREAERDICNCGNRIFVRNACTNCGAAAPWVSNTIGCGLA